MGGDPLREERRMEITNYSKDHILILTVKGRLDAVSAPGLTESLRALVERGQCFLVLDFHDLEYISSAGIRVLYQSQGRVEEGKGKMVICGANETVKRVFEMVDLSTDIPVLRDIEAAVETFRSQP